MSANKPSVDKPQASNRTLVKVCGFTQVEQARQAAKMGVDALGLVFYGPSPRCVDMARAQEIAAVVAPFCSLVGLFVDEQETVVKQLLNELPLDILQFHGDESPEYCASFGRRYMKAIRMREGLDLQAEIDRYQGASAILLDAYRPGVPGGTGEKFDWQRVPQDSAVPIVLAGGLDANNVAQAIRQTAVYGVDVSGGVERAKGDKCLSKIAQFLEAVRAR